MEESAAPALTPDQWDARDYRQPAAELDRWAEAHAETAEDDSSEYVAKLGLSGSQAVIVMNRAHDRVLVPPPARAPLAALALAGQPFGFTPADVGAVRAAAELADESTAAELRDLARRLQALLPPGSS